ncbi:MAG: hypothetical protein AB8F74_15565 [Saprospiraceae bacterium]
MKKNCKICKKEFTGRTDKIFCSTACKNDYNLRLRRATATAAKKIDEILHRNRSILLEIMGKHKVQIKTDRMTLDKKKFNFNYMTGYSINSSGKTYHHIYDFSYMTFSDQEVLIVRRRK